MKKFSDKYINKWDILKNARVGFEFEFYTDKSYYKLLEFLNRELEPIKVSGFRVYHSKFEPSKTHFKIEPDLSLGYDGVELITGPLDYVNCKPILLKTLKILQKHATVDDRCSIHINVSFDEEKTENTLNKLDPLKLILEVDEERIYKSFPVRRNNIYAKSVKKMIPFKGYDYADSALSLLKNNLELPDTKYYGINIANIDKGRLEYRYIGGSDYINKTNEILDLMDYFILLTNKCIEEDFTEDNQEALRNYLDKNINNFKSYKKYEKFLGTFPTITLQVDTMNDLNTLKTYYNYFYEDLYSLINNVESLNNCIINFDTDTHRLEVIEAKIKAIFDIKNITFVNCSIESGSFSNCIYVSSTIKNSYISTSEMMETDIVKSKIESSHINQNSKAKDCFLFNTFLNGNMEGGVFRSGKIGEFGELTKTVKIVTVKNNYFNDNDDITSDDKMKNIKDFSLKNKSDFFLDIKNKK